MHYMEETLKFIESEEMREHLKIELPKLDWFRGNDYAEIVAFAPAPIERKILVLELIVQKAKCDTEMLHNPAKLLESMHTALNERYNCTQGTVFSVQSCGEGIDSICTNFDAVLQYLCEFESDESDPDPRNRTWYQVEKWLPNDDGIMKDACYWILNAKGEIWYFGYYSEFKPADWENIHDCIGAGLNLPIPFCSGDIVIADCRPFADITHVLIVDIGDNIDCCSVQCMYLLPDGKLDMNAFKHNHFLCRDEKSPISGLYRATKFSGELEKSESILGIISDAIKNRPSLANEIMDFMFRSEHSEGVSWEVLQNKFEL